MILATALLWFAQATPDFGLPMPQQAGRVAVEVLKGRGADGEDLWNVHALNVRLSQLMAELAENQGVKLDINQSIDRSILVTAQLEGRTLKTVLNYVLGSVDLRGEVRGLVLSIDPISTEQRDPRYALIQAQVAFLQAVKSFGDAPEAPEAYLSLAEIAELLENPAAAQNNYETIIETYPDSPHALEAILRSGRLHKREGDVGAAAAQFEALISSGAFDFEPTAFLELAACKVDLFLPSHAISLLKSLELKHPTIDPPTVLERQLVLASALNGKSDWMGALRALHNAEIGKDARAIRAQFKIMAIAHGGLGEKVKASQAWMMYANDGTEAEMLFGFAQAALLALEAGENVNVLFIEAQAQGNGIDSAEIAGYAQQANERLGFKTQAAPDVDIAGKLARIERLLGERDFDAAQQPLNQLMRGRGALMPNQAQHVVILSARLIAGQKGTDEGLALLRQERVRTAQVEARTPLDLAAASLLEAANRWDEAADAYSGAY